MAATAQDPSAPLRTATTEKKDEDREEEPEYSPFYGIEKGAVLQEARCFNDPHIDVRKCQQVITKLLYLLSQGESFTKEESSAVFFSVTKLYQSKDANLRRMVYLVIKEVSAGPGEAFMITSSLVKDMNSKVELYRANAIRVLCAISDSGILQQQERYLKQAVVDKSPVVASAVLVSAQHILPANMEVVKRWSNEIGEAVQSKSGMVQFHALALLHAVRAGDRLAVSKMVTQLTRASLRSSLASFLLIRYVAQVIRDSNMSAESSGTNMRPFYDHLEQALRNKHEVVVFEAARAIASMKDPSNRELAPAIVVLQLFLSSSKPVLRFAAVRSLNKVAHSRPTLVAQANIDLENLIGDPNRSIATLAITTLLRTGNEGSVDRLLKQISGFISDIADDLKIVVVEAIRTLCLKYPTKYRALITFLATVLREDGGFEYKKAIVDAILALITAIPEAKEAGLMHLCEFIEDCEFTYLSTQILHLLGTEGPATSSPAKYIRFIYNRVILENTVVRAAAVSSLARFGAAVPALRPRITTLLARALHDNDDEVRDRATLYLAELEGSAGGVEAIVQPWDVSPAALEASLRQYLSNGVTQPFNLASVPKAPKEEPRKKEAAKEAAPALKSPTEEADAAASEVRTRLAAIPQLASLQGYFTSKPKQILTEEETEFEVGVTKHLFAEHLVLQFDIANTVQQQVLEEVSVKLGLAEAEGFRLSASVPLSRLDHGVTGQAFVVLDRDADALAMGKLTATLRYTVKEIDSTGEEEGDGYSDEYALEAVFIGVADYIRPQPVPSWKTAWDALPAESEVEDEYGLGERPSLQEAVEAVVGTLGMAVCEGSDLVPGMARSHTTLLSGVFMGNVEAAARIKFGLDPSSPTSVTMKLTVRAEGQEVSEMIHQIIQEG